MLRQDENPIAFDMTRRMDNCSVLTSFDAGVIAPVCYAPLLRGDSASGQININLALAEMPKPLENAVIARAQAWFWPKTADPRFSGIDEARHAYHGTAMSRSQSGDVTPDGWFHTTNTASEDDDEFLTTLGIHLEDGETFNCDINDAYVDIWNYRAGELSSKITKRPYRSDDASASALLPAFWPTNRMSSIVPDYEQALVKGSLDLDLSAGSVPITGIGIDGTTPPGSSASRTRRESDGSDVTDSSFYTNSSGHTFTVNVKEGATGYPDINAEMTGQTITTTLADIDKARTTQAFAKRVAAYAGHDYSGNSAEALILSELMQGYQVDDAYLRRPFLLASKTVTFGMTERHATDAANLDDSNTTGQASMSLSVNIPKAQFGGIMLCTVEVMPERMFEAAGDPYLRATSVDDLPSQIRDLQRTEPVDTVPNWRIDERHTTPDGVFGYEPMNNKWQREFTRIGGEFRAGTAGAHPTAARTAIWLNEEVDPTYTDDHHVCPHPFPHDVFSVPANHVVQAAVRQQLTITGMTQFGDALMEDNSEYTTIVAEQS
jgi:hypothetical protein